MIRGAWPLRASFLILTSVYEDQEARNRRKWMPPAAGRSHSHGSRDSRRSPRRTGSLAAASHGSRSLGTRARAGTAEQSSGRTAEGHGTGVADAEGNTEAAESCLVRLVLLPVRLFLWAKYKYYYYLPIWGWAPWP